MYVRWLKGGLWYLGLVCPVKEQLQRQMARHHMQAQLLGIGQQLIKSVVKDEVVEDEEEGLGWGENVEGEDMEMEEVVEEDPPPFHNVWTKGDMAAVKAAVKGKEKEMEKDVEVVESGGEDEEEDDEKNEKKKNWGGGGKNGGGKSGGKRVLAPWAKQKKRDDGGEKRDWVVKVDEWGGKRRHSGWYHYQGKWYPILVHDKVYKVFLSI